MVLRLKQNQYRWLMKKIKYNKRVRKWFFNEGEKFKQQVRVKARGLCGLCGDTLRTGKFQIHHIYPRRHYGHLKYKVKNGVCLCTLCHKFADRMNILQEAI